MKTTLLFRYLLFGCLGTMLSVPLEAQDAALYNQAQVNAFNDSIVPGTVHINGHDITDLTPLLKLKHAGNLRIRATGLTDLSGLDSLQSLSGKLQIENNNYLINIDALHNLKTINKLEVERNRDLINLDGLGGLEGGIDTIFIYRTELINIDSLMGLSGEVKLIDIRQNELLNLDGLIGLTAADELIIHEPNLLSLDGLYNIRQSRIVELRLNDLFSLSALAQLDVSESIDIRASGLVRLDAFYPVRELESLSISNCKYLTDFRGLDSLRHVDRLFLNDLMIYTTDVLDLSALGQLSGKMSSITISEVKDLQDLSILDGVDEIEELVLDGNRNLRNLHGIDSLQNLNKLSIKSCERFKSLIGFPQAEDSLALLILSNLPNLTKLEGLENITKLDQVYSFKAKLILEWLAISNVDELSGLSGRYGGLLKIIRNNNLQNLNGLGGLSDIGYGVHIQNNPLLDSCCVLKDLLPGLEFTTIVDNRPSCSRDEILKTDGVCNGNILIDPDPDPIPGEIPAQFSIVELSPNPAQGQVKILYGSPDETLMQIRVIDIQGRSVTPNQDLPVLKGYAKVNLDLSHLNPGLYFIQMTEPEFGKVHKLVLY